MGKQSWAQDDRKLSNVISLYKTGLRRGTIKSRDPEAMRGHLNAAQRAVKRNEIAAAADYLEMAQDQLRDDAADFVSFALYPIPPRPRFNEIAEYLANLIIVGKLQLWTIDVDDTCRTDILEELQTAETWLAKRQPIDAYLCLYRAATKVHNSGRANAWYAELYRAAHYEVKRAA